MPNFHRDELFLQHDLNGRNTIYQFIFFMHKTALACHILQRFSFIGCCHLVTFAVVFVKYLFTVIIIT